MTKPRIVLVGIICIAVVGGIAILMLMNRSAERTDETLPDALFVSVRGQPKQFGVSGPSGPGLADSILVKYAAETPNELLLTLSNTTEHYERRRLFQTNPIAPDWAGAFTMTKFILPGPTALVLSKEDWTANKSSPIKVGRSNASDGPRGGFRTDAGSLLYNEQPFKCLGKIFLSADVTSDEQLVAIVSMDGKVSSSPGMPALGPQYTYRGEWYVQVLRTADCAQVGPVFKLQTPAALHVPIVVGWAAPGRWLILESGGFRDCWVIGHDWDSALKALAPPAQPIQTGDKK